MSPPQIVITGCLCVLAVAHSALGESDIIRPLFAAEWEVPLPRWAAQRILRFAWHLTSMAWLALAVIASGGDHLLTIGVLTLASAAVIFAALRGHLAWPIFLLAGLAALREAGAIGDRWLEAGAAVTAVVLLAASALHVYWAVGGRWLVDRAVPGDATDRFTPGPMLTLLVAGALAVFGLLVWIEAFGPEYRWLHWLAVAGVSALVIRAIGDGRVAGFTKAERHSRFAVADDRYFTPLVVFLALGATGAVLV